MSDVSAFENGVTESGTSRRDFIATSTGLLAGGWLWLRLPALSALAGCAREAARTDASFVTFSAEEGSAMGAFASRIIPSDSELPGAEEAGAVYFADRALEKIYAQFLQPVRAGLADLDSRARVKQGKTFAEVDAATQDAILRDVERSDFFFMARTLVVMGVFADPSYGGNRDGVGERILAIVHQPVYQPPFGYYDADAARAGGAP